MRDPKSVGPIMRPLFRTRFLLLRTPAVARVLMEACRVFTDLTGFLADLVLSPKSRAPPEWREEAVPPDVWQLKGLKPGMEVDLRAVWYGVSLERALRDLCGKHNLPVGPEDTIDALNNRLAKSGVYDKLTQKRVGVWGEIRNRSVHGHFGQYTKADVDELERWIEEFVRRHLT